MNNEDGKHVYVRHHNTWEFDFADFDVQVEKVDRPAFVSDLDWEHFSTVESEPISIKPPNHFAYAPTLHATTPRTHAHIQPLRTAAAHALTHAHHSSDLIQWNRPELMPVRSDALAYPAYPNYPNYPNYPQYKVPGTSRRPACVRACSYRILVRSHTSSLPCVRTAESDYSMVAKLGIGIGVGGGVALVVVGGLTTYFILQHRKKHVGYAPINNDDYA